MGTMTTTMSKDDGKPLEVFAATPSSHHPRRSHPHPPTTRPKTRPTATPPQRRWVRPDRGSWQMSWRCLRLQLFFYSRHIVSSYRWVFFFPLISLINNNCFYSSIILNTVTAGIRETRAGSGWWGMRAGARDAQGTCFLLLFSDYTNDFCSVSIYYGTTTTTYNWDKGDKGRQGLESRPSTCFFKVF
jgi:hypothetical protein